MFAARTATGALLGIARVWNRGTLEQRLALTVDMTPAKEREAVPARNLKIYGEVGVAKVPAKVSSSLAEKIDRR